MRAPEPWARAIGLSCALALTCAASCTPKPTRVPTYPALPGTQAGAGEPSANDDSARQGGRLFDNPWRELRLGFVPDDPKTPASDGKGGPFGDGTLKDEQGKPLKNEGHDYRLKNLLGWDLHGAAGISGERYQNSAWVLLPDLLANKDERATWIARLTRGEDAIPAYGDVLAPAQIEAIVDFLLGVRDGALPRPDELFSLDEQVPGFYRLAPGGDAARGHALIEKTCRRCHGADGTRFPLEHGRYSLGTFLRARASSAWLKILVGQAGTSMGPQLDKSLARPQLTEQLLDMLAAACDRARYPRGASSEPEVPDGDARCGAYLK